MQLESRRSMSWKGRLDMDDQPKNLNECVEIADEDVEAALRDLETYVDISPGDLKALCLSTIKHAQQRIAQSQPVGEIMTRQVVGIGRDADLREVSRLLSDNNISGLPVIDDQSRVIGVITEKDVLAMTGVKRGHTTRELIKHLLGEPLARRQEGREVADFMTTPAITVPPETDIRKAAAMMSEKGIKRLIVVDGNGTLVGIVTRADIVRAVGGK
jgi:CBS-domain-containing membrane protein